MRCVNWFVWGMMIAAFAAGCTSSVAPEAAKPPAGDSTLLLSAEPPGARGVEAVRKAAKDGEEVVVVGRIGGDENPWVEGTAVFLLADESLVPCNEKPGDNCPKPWDYCCETDRLKDCTVQVKFVDAQGEPLASDARELLGVKELATVVVRGVARRAGEADLSIEAAGVFVKK